jgi:[ribosomal protein S5]-alanine N-acetyltransferase
VQKPILETVRLLLREMSLADLDFVAAMLAHADVMRFYPKCYSREEAEVWVQRQTRRYARHGHGLWLVWEKATEQPVGQVGLLIQNFQGVEEKEVAYLIHRPFWRRGFATEAALACRDYAFDVLGRRRVIALIRPENGPSQTVAQRLGMAAEPDAVWHSGFEHHIFSVSRSDAP